MDVEAIQRSIVGKLPRRARWDVLGTPVAYDFSIGHDGPRALVAHDFNFDPGDTWSDLLLFGAVDYADGGGASPYLVIRRTDGVVYGLDVERAGEPLFLLNSSLAHFIETFSYLNGCAGAEAWPPDMEAKVRAIDSSAYLESDWKLLVDHLMTGERD
jgi:hypothetical protein